MTNKKTELIGLRMSPKYKDALERMAKQRGVSVQWVLLDLVRQGIKSDLSHNAYLATVEHGAKVVGIPAHVAYALLGGNELYKCQKIEEGIITSAGIDQLKNWVDGHYPETLESFKKEFGYGDDMDEFLDEVADKE